MSDQEDAMEVEQQGMTVEELDYKGTEKLRNKVKMITGEDPTCATFILEDEDHTLGNALRYCLMQNPSVDVCGYSMPHPSDNKLNLRIQTTGASAASIFLQGLDDLMARCDHIMEQFNSELEKKEYEELEGISF